MAPTARAIARRGDAVEAAQHDLAPLVGGEEQVRRPVELGALVELDRELRRARQRELVRRRLVGAELDARERVERLQRRRRLHLALEVDERVVAQQPRQRLAPRAEEHAGRVCVCPRACARRACLRECGLGA